MLLESKIQSIVLHTLMFEFNFWFMANRLGVLNLNVWEAILCAFRAAFLNRRVATRQRVVKDFQRVAELLSKNTYICIIAPNKDIWSKMVENYHNLPVQNIIRPFLLKGEGKSGHMRNATSELLSKFDFLAAEAIKLSRIDSNFLEYQIMI